MARAGTTKYMQVGRMSFGTSAPELLCKQSAIAWLAGGISMLAAGPWGAWAARGRLQVKARGPRQAMGAGNSHPYQSAGR